MLVATASRASSCRNTTSVPPSRSTPAARHSSSAVNGCPETAASTSISAWKPITAAAASTSRAAAESRAARASTASRTVGGTDAVAACEHLGDVEGVAAGAFAERVQVDVRTAGQLRHRGAAQRPHADAADPSDGRELAEQHPNGMVGPDLVVAEGEQQQGGAVLAAPGEVPDQLQRRGVRPVHVLDQPDGRLGAQRRPHGREQADPVDRLARVGGHVDAERGRDVHQGPQRRRRGGPVAAAAQHPARRGGHEVRGQAGLPGAGLAADQYRRADAATGLVQRGGQRAQFLGPLQQHAPS